MFLKTKCFLEMGCFFFVFLIYFFSSKSSNRDILYIYIKKIKVLKSYNVFPGVPQTWHSQTANPAQVPLPIHTLEPDSILLSPPARDCHTQPAAMAGYS